MNIHQPSQYKFSLRTDQTGWVVLTFQIQMASICLQREPLSNVTGEYSTCSIKVGFFFKFCQDREMAQWMKYFPQRHEDLIRALESTF